MRRKIVMILVAAVVAVAFMPASAFAGSKAVKMTSYDDVIKSGKTVYCSSSSGIYKVTLKKGKPKKVKGLVKYARQTNVIKMKKSGKYLYYNESEFSTNPEDQIYNLKRMKTSGAKKKTYARSIDGPIFYALKGKNIYFELMEARQVGEDDWDDYMIDYVMKQTGSLTKKETDKYPKMKCKKTNKKGYKIIEVVSGNYIKTYLKVPKAKKKYLGKCLKLQ